MLTDTGVLVPTELIGVVVGVRGGGMVLVEAVTVMTPKPELAAPEATSARTMPQYRAAINIVSPEPACRLNIANEEEWRMNNEPTGAPQSERSERPESAQ